MHNVAIITKHAQHKACCIALSLLLFEICRDDSTAQKKVHAWWLPFHYECREYEDELDQHCHQVPSILMQHLPHMLQQTHEA